MDLNEIHSAFVADMTETNRIRDRIEMRRKQIERLEKKLHKQPFWRDSSVKHIAEALEERYPDRYADVLGPFGLGSEVSIHLYKKGVSKDKRTEGNNCISITFRPGDLDKGELLIKDYRQNTGRFAGGTVGEVNGFNFPSIPFDWKMDTLVRIIEELNAYKGK